ncbi:MAG: hypothetical protein QM688_16400 [Sphingomonas bacterium]
MRAAAGALLALLAACSSQPATPGAVSADEERQLNEAAASLDANSVDAPAGNDEDQEQR